MARPQEDSLVVLPAVSWHSPFPSDDVFYEMTKNRLKPIFKFKANKEKLMVAFSVNARWHPQQAQTRTRALWCSLLTPLFPP